MYINPGYTVGILNLTKGGMNSTMFTECCETAICDDEPKCPACGGNIIGYNSTPAERGRIRWNDATKHWRK